MVYWTQFSDIQKYISFQYIESLYPTLHKVPEEKFASTANRIIRSKSRLTKLCTLRKTSGYKQKELAEKSGVSLRTLQQYETRGKDINKAASASLMALAKVLGCHTEDLLEYETTDV